MFQNQHYVSAHYQQKFKSKKYWLLSIMLLFTTLDISYEKNQDSKQRSRLKVLTEIQNVAFFNKLRL
jgi:hypothetical protein